MKALRKTFLILICTTFLFARCDDSKPASPATSTAGPTNTTVATLVTLVNSHRAGIGCPTLIWDTKLAEVAVAHSQEMHDNDYLSHTDLAGHTPFQRMQDAGLSFTAAAENVALDGQGAQDTFDGWMASSGHKANIENCTYTHHGVGLVGSHWTHMFMLPN